MQGYELVNKKFKAWISIVQSHSNRCKFTAIFDEVNSFFDKRYKNTSQNKVVIYE